MGHKCRAVEPFGNPLMTVASQQSQSNRSKEAERRSDGGYEEDRTDRWLVEEPAAQQCQQGKGNGHERRHLEGVPNRTGVNIGRCVPSPIDQIAAHTTLAQTEDQRPHPDGHSEDTEVPFCQEPAKQALRRQPEGER